MFDYNSERQNRLYVYDEREKKLEAKCRKRAARAAKGMRYMTAHILIIVLIFVAVLAFFLAVHGMETFDADSVTAPGKAIVIEFWSVLHYACLIVCAVLACNTFCPSCGRRVSVLVAWKHCRHCGHKLMDDKWDT